MAERPPIDELFTVAGVCVLGDRPVPLPKDLREQLPRAAEAFDEWNMLAIDRPVNTDADIAQELLAHAAFACIAYPYYPEPLAALRAAYALLALLRAPAPQSEPKSWEERAGLIGGG